MMTDDHTNVHANPQTPQPYPTLARLAAFVGVYARLILDHSGA